MGADVSLEADESELIDLNHVLAKAVGELKEFFSTLSDDVNATISGWHTTGSDSSRQAADAALAKIVADGQQMAEALKDITIAVGEYAAEVRDTELRNVAITD